MSRDEEHQAFTDYMDEAYYEASQDELEVGDIDGVLKYARKALETAILGREAWRKECREAEAEE